MNELTGFDLICIAPVDWEPIWNRSQQVMWRLPGSVRILYLEPPATLLSALKDPSLCFKWWRWAGGPRQINQNIHLYSPPVILPFGNVFPWINRINQWWLSFFVAGVARRLGFNRPVTWTYLPGSLPLIRRLNPGLIVYDCVDEHSQFTGLIKPGAVLSMERDLLAASDLVFATAPGLYQAKKPYARNIHLIPNAADVAHFGRAQLEETPVPADVAELPRPLLGFVGVIHHWIDLELIEYLARRRPDWTVAMIGPVGAGVGVEGLKSLPNVHLLGRRDKGQLPGYLKAFDVCLNTFKKNELTDRVNPLKIYEYLAAGKPVVSVDMPGVAEFREVIEIAGDYEGFLGAVERTLAQESPEKKQRRLQTAAENSWEKRVETMLDLIEKTIGSGPGVGNPESRIQNPE